MKRRRMYPAQGSRKFRRERRHQVLLRRLRDIWHDFVQASRMPAFPHLETFVETGFPQPTGERWDVTSGVFKVGAI